MTSSNRIAVAGESDVGVARRVASELCGRLSTDQTVCGKAAIIVTEMARNLVRHGKGGEMIIRQTLTPAASNLELLALDRGPGLQNFAEALRDGFSTTGTAGNGLGAIKRLSDRFELFSQPGRGTVAWAELHLSKNDSVTDAFESSGVSVAIDGERQCGDAWEVLESEGVLRAMVVDGLGHGAFAEEAALEALAVFRVEAGSGAGATLQLIDKALTKTRGAAGAIAELDPKKGSVTIAGVGNVSARLLYDGQSKSFGSDNGTLGTGVRKVSEFNHPWTPGCLLVMHSDGMKTRWSLDDYPGILRKSPGLIAGLLYRDFRRGGDDATVIVVRHRL